jgi:hypothetical protein
MWKPFEAVESADGHLMCGQENVSPEMALQVHPLLLHAATGAVGGGTGGTALGVAVGEGVRGVPPAAPLLPRSRVR